MKLDIKSVLIGVLLTVNFFLLVGMKGLEQPRVTYDIASDGEGGLYKINNGGLYHGKITKIKEDKYKGKPQTVSEHNKMMFELYTEQYYKK